MEITTQKLIEVKLIVGSLYNTKHFTSVGICYKTMRVVFRSFHLTRGPMHIESVTHQTFSRGIALKGWDSVVSALTSFSRGDSRRVSRTAKAEFLDSTEKAHGAMAVGMVLLFDAQSDRGTPDRFVTRILQEAKEEIEKRGSWSEDYDYDAMSTAFFKTTVKIHRADVERDIYILQISGKYGEESEEGLAQCLGVTRCLVQDRITLTVEPRDENHFEFDFDQLVRMLAELLVLDTDLGVRIAEHMMRTTSFEGPEKFVLIDDGYTRVSMCMGSVGRRLVEVKPSRKVLETWTRTGSIITGPLADSFDKVPVKVAPTIEFYIEESERHKPPHRRFLPTFDIDTVALI